MTKFCHLCGQPILGNERTYHHPQWTSAQLLRVCQDCDQSKPHCRICGLPIGEPSSQSVCQICGLQQQRCLTCGKPIKTRYYEVDGRGPYCAACHQERDRCDICTAPLTDQHWVLSDGRRTCDYCHTTAIYSPEDALALYEQMQSVIVEKLGIDLNVPTGLALVDRNQLAEIIRLHSNGPETLDPDRTLGIYVRHGMRRAIYAQTGLPRALLLQIASHEYAHAWQGENCPILREPLMREGFAEWTAYKVLGYYGYAHQQERMKSRTDLYGQGLKWALTTEANQGSSGVIQACKKAKRS